MADKGPVPDGALSDQALRAAVDVAPDGVVVVDQHGLVVFANPTLLQMFGYEASELVGRSVEVLVPDEQRDRHAAHRTGYAATPRTRPMGSGLDLRGRHKDGHEFPVEIGLSPVPDREAPRVIAIIRDVTERRHSAEELMRAHEQLALVDDRERIARDLHDTVIQRLFAVGLSLQGVLARAHAAEVGEVAERIELAVDEIDATIRDLRTAIFALQTRRGSELGSREMVLQLTREAERALGFKPRVEFRGLIDTKITKPVREQFVPALREALSNVAKHAHASRVQVTLAVDDDVLLRVEDNGIGITGDASGGSGLANIAERATDLGGTCIVKAGSRGGTVVEWRVPTDGADGSS